MSLSNQISNTISLKSYGIKNAHIHYQLTPNELHDLTLKNAIGKEVSSGALAINTGEFTGRSPKDRYIVKDDLTSPHVWWGDINLPFETDKFDKLYEKVIAYLDEKELYVRDSYVCADHDYRINLRVVTEFPWSNLFAYNMFLRPSKAELANFIPEWTIINAPSFKANPELDGTRQHNFTIINFTKKIILIGGTGYTGEIKKSIFSVLNFILPVQMDALPMHCSANTGIAGDTAIFFGLSGTGKTTLSADPHRKLIGDDEHGWTNKNTIFNFEGGCYAKVINLSIGSEPEIFSAIKKGALLENVIVDKNNNVDFTDTSITQNTRVSYPIYHVDNHMDPSIGENPRNIFFLTADAFGVIPPISKLTPGQAAYHFISGYTAKVAGTETGIVEPTPSFSACFGAPFMPLHPTKYAEMLSRKMKEADVNVWLVNTGWTGGPYGTGTRIKLKHTRAMIQAAINGNLDLYGNDKYNIHSVFGVAQPIECPGVPKNVLCPKVAWNNDLAYYTVAFKLANAFRENFVKFDEYANKETRQGGPIQYSF